MKNELDLSKKAVGSGRGEPEGDPRRGSEHGESKGALGCGESGSALALGAAAEIPAFDAFVFDLDGTLIDTLPDLVTITNKALEEGGYPTRSEEEILSYVGNGLRSLMAQAVPEGTSEEDAVRALKRWKAIHRETGDPQARPYPHVPEVLAELKARGCKLAVLSNKFDGGVHQVMDACLPGMFDVMYGERPDIPRKPDPTGYLRVMSELGVEPGRCVYVGDSPGDVKVARNAGTFAVGVTWGYRVVEDFTAEGAEPDRWISDIRELLELAPA